MRPRAHKTPQHFERARDRVEGQHAKLAAVRGEVESTLAAGSAEDIRLAVHGYSAAVEAHFELEEQAYFPSPADVDADAAANISSLIADHKNLREELSNLRDLLKADDMGELACAFETFAHDLAEHEAREEATMEYLAQG